MPAKGAKIVMSMQTDIKKWGNGTGIRLSKEILNKAFLEVNDTLDVVVVNKGKIVLKKSESFGIRKLLASVDPACGNKGEACSWGDSQGAEYKW